MATIPRLVFTNGGRRLVTVGGRSLVGRRPPGATVSVAQWTIPTEGSPVVARITVSRTLLVPVVVTYATTPGTATAGTDYTTTNGSTSIPAGQTHVDVSVPTAARSGAQGSRAFTFTVTDAAASGEDITIDVPSASMTIQDSATVTTTVAALNKSVTEGSVAQVRVSRSESSAQPVTFNYETTPGTAAAGTDYTHVSSAGTILAGQSSVDIPVTTALRSGNNGTRALSFTISSAVMNGTPLTITTPTATVTIVDTESDAFEYHSELAAHATAYAPGTSDLRDQAFLDAVVSGPATYSPNQIAAGSPGYYDATKRSRVWSYVFPNDDYNTDIEPSAPGAPKDAARFYFDPSATGPGAYGDPAVPLLERLPWHRGGPPPREQSLFVPITKGSGRLIVVIDEWYHRGWWHNRTDPPRQWKSFRFLMNGDNKEDFSSAMQVGEWPTPTIATDGTPAGTTAVSWGRLMNLLSAEVDDYDWTLRPNGHSDHDPVWPTGLNARPTKALNMPHGEWTRHVWEIRMFEPHTAFTEWNTATGTTLQYNTLEPDGSWHMVSGWLMTETGGPWRILYRRPWFTNNRKNFSYFNFNNHTSQGDRTATGPLVKYARGMVTLHDYMLPDVNPESDTFIFRRPLA